MSSQDSMNPRPLRPPLNPPPHDKPKRYDWWLIPIALVLTAILNLLWMPYRGQETYLDIFVASLLDWATFENLAIFMGTFCLELLLLMFLVGPCNNDRS